MRGMVVGEGSRSSGVLLYFVWIHKFQTLANLSYLPRTRNVNWFSQNTQIWFNSIPLIPACTARPGLPLSPPEIAFLESPYYRPQTASWNDDLDRRSPSPNKLSFSHLHTKRWRCKPDTTMITNNFCACGLFKVEYPAENVSFSSSFGRHSFEFRRVLTAARQQWTLNSDSELDFVVLWPWSLVKTDVLRQIWLLKRCWFTSSSSRLGCPMSTVIRVTLTALLLRCPWQQRFFDIQTSANLRKFVLSFVSSIWLKNRMPVIPFPSERVFNSATFLPMLIPLKTLRNFSNLHFKIFSG